MSIDKEEIDVSIQLLQQSEVAELRWDGAIELILEKGPEKSDRIK